MSVSATPPHPSPYTSPNFVFKKYIFYLYHLSFLLFLKILIYLSLIRLAAQPTLSLTLLLSFFLFSLIPLFPFPHFHFQFFFPFSSLVCVVLGSCCLLRGVEFGTLFRCVSSPIQLVLLLSFIPMLLALFIV